MPGAAFFTRQTFRPRHRCEESRHRAIHGESLSNRVSANAVNAEVIFRRGDLLPISVTKPLREMHRAGAIGSRSAHGGRNAPPKAGVGEQGAADNSSVRRASARRNRQKNDHLRIVHFVEKPPRPDAISPGLWCVALQFLDLWPEPRLQPQLAVYGPAEFHEYPSIPAKGDCLEVFLKSLGFENPIFTRQSDPAVLGPLPNPPASVQQGLSWPRSLPSRRHR